MTLCKTLCKTLRTPLQAATVALALLLATASASGAPGVNPFAVPDFSSVAGAVASDDDEGPGEVRGLAGSALRGVILGSRPMANVDGAILAVGDDLNGWRLVRVDSARATFERDGETIVLALEHSALAPPTGETP